MAELSDEQVFGAQTQPQKELSDAEVFASSPQQTAQPRGIQEVGQALQERPSASKLFSRQSLSDIISGADLKSVPMDVLKSLTPITEAPRAIKQAIDLVRGVPAEQAVPGIGELKGIEQKPLRERLSTGLDVATQLAFAGTIGEGLSKPASLHESLFGKTEDQPLASETAASKEVINNATQEGVVKENNIVQHPGDGEGGTPTETSSSSGTQPITQAPQEKVATAPEAFPSLLQSAEDARRAELRQEPSPVSEPTETTTDQPLTQEKGGEVGEKVQVQGEDEGKGKEGVLTPEAATVQPPAAPPEKVQPGEFGKTGYTAVDSAEPTVSRIANRFTQERSASGEIGEIAPGQGYSTKELLQRGLKMPPEQINQHISDLMQRSGGDPIEQASAVRANEAQLSQRSNQLSREAEADPGNMEKKLAADNAFKDLTDFHNGPVARIKEIFHGTGQSMQQEIPVDLSTFNGMKEAWLKDTGKSPPPEVEPLLRTVSKKVAGVNGEADASVAKLGDAVEQATKRRKLPTHEQVRDSILERLKNMPCK